MAAARLFLTPLMKCKPLLLLSLATALALVAGALSFRGSLTHRSTKDVAQGTAANPSSQSQTASDGITLRDASPRMSDDKHPDQTEKVNPENYSSNDPQQPWEKEIIALSDRLDMTDTAKAEQLLAKINSLPPDGKVLAMEYATKLIPDEDYLRLRAWIFKLVSSDELRETVMLDALTRSEALRMPTLVEMLRQPPNPAQEEVREILLAYLDKDYGTDTKGWDAAVQKFLAENPDL